MNKKKLFLSIIIPIFNETIRLKNIYVIDTYLRASRITYEIVIVNDGSNKETREILCKIQRSVDVTVISYKINRGKGYALKKGIMKAQGSYILFSDIDCSTPIEEFKKFIPYLHRFDVIIASRRIRKARIEERQSFLREFLGRIFTYLSTLTVGVSLSDFTCGFKCFSNTAGKSIFSKLTINRWGYDVEAMYLAKKYGYRIKEIPVRWKNDPDTKVRFPHDIIFSLRDLLKIKKNILQNKYKH